MNKDKKKVMISKSGLKYRGWTETLIKKFLKEPDELATNPHYKCTVPMLLYSERRVKKIEKRKDFINLQERAYKRKEAARKAVETKRKKIIDYVNNLEIVIPFMDNKELDKKARASYDEYHSMRHDWDYDIQDYSPFYFQSAFDSEDEKFIKRITINYLRHQCTDYEEQLNSLFGKVGIQEGHDILQKRINDKIREVYPHLR